MSLIDISNNMITLISFIVNLFFIVPFVYKLYKYLMQNRFIERIFDYNSDPIQIYQSTFKFHVANGNKYSFIECSSLEEIHNLLNIFDFKTTKFVFTNHDDSARNEICIGGSFYNKRTNSYFIKYFSEFKEFVDFKHKNKLENADIDTQMVEYSDNRFGFKIDEDTFLETVEYKKDYAFLIKLTPNDFNIENKKVVHILFGGTYIGTIKATEYLKSHCKEIYRKYKNKHYFFAIEINLIDNSFNDRIGIIDLTDKMFNSTSKKIEE